MPHDTYKSSVLVLVPFVSSLFCDVYAAPSNDLTKRVTDALILDYSPSASAEEGAPAAADALRDPVFLPAQIGGIVGSYAFSLVVVAIVLLSLAKRRREHLRSGDIDDEDEAPHKSALHLQYPLKDIPPFQTQETFPYALEPPRSPITNFSYPTPISPTRTEHSGYVYPSPVSSYAPGVDFSVDQTVVAKDRQMAQSQLEEMYKYVMEQEAAKQAGVEAPPVPCATTPRLPAASSSTTTLNKKEKAKPANLNLREEKTQSRASSILSVLSPRKKKAPQALSISSPIMTPMTGTFPRAEGEDMGMGAIPPRHYAPPPPPPIPTDQVPYQQAQRRTVVAPLLTPETSPHDTMSIDERLGAQIEPKRHGRNVSAATTDADPQSAVSEVSTSPLVGLPSSPKPSVTRFPSLPLSPKPGATFQRANAPSAVRTGGSLPLRAYESSQPGSAIRSTGALPFRAYESSMASPSVTSPQVKQTTFERSYPLSPGGGRTPMTGMPVPYTPYQPFSPVIPMTPSLVTRADRKRMRKLEPKTPTLQMVKSDDEMW